MKAPGLPGWFRCLALWAPVLCAAVCAAQTTQAPPARVPALGRSLSDWVRIETNISYDRYPSTVLDILQPRSPSAGKRPGVIMFHGGGWIESSKETMMTHFCLPYLRHGFVVCNVEYRLAPAATAPAAVLDALDAARWFFAHANNYGVDTNRIVVTGASAGAHLALMVGMASAAADLGPPVHVAAIVNCYGITDVADLLQGPHRKGWAARWLPPQAGRSELARRVSPLTYVRPGLPPVLTIQGADDHTVPPAQGAQLTRALRRAGVEARLILVPHAGHGFSRRQWPGLEEKIFAFLASRGILETR